MSNTDPNLYDPALVMEQIHEVNPDKTATTTTTTRNEEEKKSGMARLKQALTPDKNFLPLKLTW
jgi:hypothetical protein